jgi:hypothetical protein
MSGLNSPRACEAIANRYGRITAKVARFAMKAEDADLAFFGVRFGTELIFTPAFDAMRPDWLVCSPAGMRCNFLGGWRLSQFLQIPDFPC